MSTTRKRRTPEQVVRKLSSSEADRLLARGADTAEVARQLGVSEQTYFRWRNQFGGLKAEDAKRLKELEKENARPKRHLADAELEKVADGTGGTVEDPARVGRSRSCRWLTSTPVNVSAGWSSALSPAKCSPPN